MSEVAKFMVEVQGNIERLRGAAEVQERSRQWVRDVGPLRYAYNFSWMGRPIIQLPQDIVAMQELIWQIKPALIVETGVAHGGSLIFYASMLELLGQGGRVIGVDIDIRAHNRAAIVDHPMSKRIEQQYEVFFAQYRRWYRGRVFPVSEGISVFFRDVTEEKQLEDQLALERLLRWARIQRCFLQS